MNKKIESDRWYKLKVEINGRHIEGYVDGELTLEFDADHPIKGHVGIWTKADSVTAFRELEVNVAKDEDVVNSKCQGRRHP